MNTNKNVIKNCKIIDGYKYYELNIKREYYFINITNLPKENLIKFKLFLKRLDEIKKEEIITFENEFNLEYFTNQTKFFNDLGIKDINGLIEFFYTYFTKYDNKKEDDLIDNKNDNQNLVILKLLMFQNKIQINIELYQMKNINNKNFINKDLNDEKQIKLSNSCENININIKKKLKGEEKISKNKYNNNFLLTEYHISLIKKRIPFFKNMNNNFKLNLIYKSASEKIKNFHIKCDNKGPTLIIIFTKENRMFLTFNKKQWNAIKNSELNKVNWRLINVQDDDIFIFDLFSKKILKKKENKNEKGKEKNFKFLQQYDNYGPAYTDKGVSFKVIDEDKYLSIEFITTNIEEDSYIKSNYNLEKNNFLHIQDYEVYNII